MKNHNKIFRQAVMLRTYCREYEDPLESGVWKKETEDDVINRVLDNFTDYYHHLIVQIPWFRWKHNGNWWIDWFTRMKEGKALPAGRMLWSMGSDAIGKEGFLPLMNCGFVAIDEPIEPIKFILKMLMLGCGMGFSLEEKHFHNAKLLFAAKRYPGTTFEWNPQIIRDDANPESYFVKDSREGWIDFFAYLMEKAITMKKVIFSLRDLRPANSRIKGFGGRTGSPDLLGTAAIRVYKLMTREPVPSISMYYDVICTIAELVVSGNVRRSALICIGDPDSEEFLGLKKFDRLQSKPWRCNCNNSVNIKSFDQLTDKFWEGYNGNGEPYGIVNIEKARESEMKHRRYLPVGTNPCGEQPLANYEVCCLGEVNLSRAVSEHDLFCSLVMCYFFCKFAYELDCPVKATKDVCSANQRIGISLTGISMVSQEKREWAYRCKNHLRKFDKELSELLDVPTSVALTTIKPGGTLPKIAGSSGPGIHRPISQYQIRRVRFAKYSKLLPKLIMAGIHVEPSYLFSGEEDPSGTQVASFYLENEVPDDGHYSDWQLTEEGFKSMLDLVAEVQEKWSENSISVTLYYNIEQLEMVKRELRRVFPKLKSISLLPYFGHNFPQAPEEPVSKETFEKFISEHPFDPDTEIPSEPDSTQEELEDFGLCESRSQCSERG